MSSIVVAGDTSGSITIAAPAVAGSGTLTLPVATDTLVGKATTDTLTNKSIAATQLTGTIAAAALPAGTVLQVVSTTKTDVFSTTSTSYTDITGLSVSITPKFSTSKIYVIVSVYQSNALTDGRRTLTQLVRGTTPICIGTGGIGTAGSTYNGSASVESSGPFSISYLDSPATTSSTTYKMQANSVDNSTMYINRSSATQFSGASSITVMEIAG